METNQILNSMKSKFKKNSIIVDLVSRLEKNEYLWKKYYHNERPFSFPLSPIARAGLESYSLLLKEIRTLPRLEQYFAHEGMQLIRKSVKERRDLGYAEQNKSDLYKDLELSGEVVRRFWHSLMWMNERDGKLNLSIDSSKKGMLYNPFGVLYMFKLGSDLQELGFSKVWQFAHSRGYAPRVSDESQGLKVLAFIRDVSEKVINNQIPEPTHRGIVHFLNCATQFLESSLLSREEYEKIEASMQYFDPIFWARLDKTGETRKYHSNSSITLPNIKKIREINLESNHLYSGRVFFNE